MSAAIQAGFKAGNPAAELELFGKIVSGDGVKLLPYEPARGSVGYTRHNRASAVVERIVRIREPPRVIPSNHRPIFLWA